MPTDLGSKLLFEGRSRTTRLGKSCRNEYGCRNLFGGATIDDAQDCVMRHGDEDEIDGTRDSSKRGHDREPCDLPRMRINRNDRSGKATSQERVDEPKADAVRIAGGTDDRDRSWLEERFQ
jgi:hypothetical protein